jgi:hypothetical protein
VASGPCHPAQRPPRPQRLWPAGLPDKARQERHLRAQKVPFQRATPRHPWAHWRQCGAGIWREPTPCKWRALLRALLPRLGPHVAALFLGFWSAHTIHRPPRATGLCVSPKCPGIWVSGIWVSRNWCTMTHPPAALQCAIARHRAADLASGRPCHGEQQCARPSFFSSLPCCSAKPRWRGRNHRTAIRGAPATPHTVPPRQPATSPVTTSAWRLCTAFADIAIETRTIARRIRADPIPTDNRKNGGSYSRKSTQVGRPVPRRGESEGRVPTQ